MRFKLTPKPQLNLAAVRQERNLSLQQISDQTKISVRFLIAIEEEEFEKLPGGVFNTSYLRQYASAIGYEPAQLLAYYGGRTRTEQSQSEKSHRWSLSW